MDIPHQSINTSKVNVKDESKKPAKKVQVKVEPKELLEVLDETNEQNPIMKSGVVINPDTDGIMISSSELKSVLGLYNE